MCQEISLIRHGQTEWSLSGQHTGHTDLALTEHGELEARQLGGFLRGRKFTHVWTSPLQRARRTCELAGLGGPARVDPNLREWNYGDYEGLTTAEIHGRLPGWKVYRDGSPGGESVEEVRARADAVIGELRQLAGTVAVFSHGHFLRALAVRWLGLPLLAGEHFNLDTSSLSILGYQSHNPEMPAITLWNLVPGALHGPSH